MAKQPSQLMTAAEVATIWHLTPRTVKARVKPSSLKRNRVEPLYTSPDLRWDRAAVYADLDRCRQQRRDPIAEFRSQLQQRGA